MSKPDATTEDVLREVGHSHCIEYRRAARRQYRARQRRIEYLPDSRAMAGIEKAIAEGWALSMTDAINQAVTAWVDAMSEDEPPE